MCWKRPGASVGMDCIARSEVGASLRVSKSLFAKNRRGIVSPTVDL